MDNFRWNEYTTGVCYYPEHWPESMWEEDLMRMKQNGITVVRISEFSWSILEPEEGVFAIGYYDDFLDLCRKHEIFVIMGTPTATPPVWLTEKYPEVLNTDANGVLYRHGGRRHYNYNSPVYQKLCCRIVEKMAEHYAQHPSVIGWQIDNELNCEACEFYSEADTLAFREFLKKKYETLDRLNEVWGTVVWSETYTKWEQIYVPRPVINMSWNPHLRLDYYRFVSESAIKFSKMQADLIYKYKKENDFITTNGMFPNLDNHELMDESLNTYMYDSYPDFAFELIRSPKTSTDLNDRKWTRNLAETRSVDPHFGIMEQQSGGCGWVTRMEAPTPRPGQLGLWAMQSISQGADFVSFFRWRTALFGTEMYWHGIIDYDNRDNRKLQEVKTFAENLKKIGSVCGSDFVAPFALLKDYDNEWDRRTDVWHERIASASEKEIFCAAEVNHTPYNIVYLRDQEQDDAILRYPVILYPHPMIMTEQRKDLLTRYVKEGGILILGCRSGLKDVNGKMVMMPQPGLLQELTGTDIREFTYTSPNEDAVTMTWGEETFVVPVFNDVLELLDGTKAMADTEGMAGTECMIDSQCLAVYDNSYYAGKAALTEHVLGKGKVLHFGGTFTRELMKKLFQYTGILEPFAEDIKAPEEVQIVKRQKDGKDYYFVLNYMDAEQTIYLDQQWKNMVSGELLQGSVGMKAFEVMVLER